jgi:ribosomal protein L32
MKMHSKARKRARRLRQQIVAALGSACACCGETIRAALTIDHRQNDGAEHRREFPDVRDLYRQIIAEGCPRERYQILCRNCHESKNERGECAHVAEARAIFFGLAV